MAEDAVIEILLAEDEETDAFFAQQAFEQSGVKNNVHIVKDGQEAMEFLKKEGTYADAPRPNIIFLDIKMPRKDGHETLAEIKTDPDLKNIPVIMLSSSNSEDDIQKSYDQQANAYVPKSTGFQEMINFVNIVEAFWFAKAKLPK